jgi:hypothetical protein
MFTGRGGLAGGALAAGAGGTACRLSRCSSTAAAATMHPIQTTTNAAALRFLMNLPSTSKASDARELHAAAAEAL